MNDFAKTEWNPGDVTANSLEFMFDTEEEFDRCKTAFDGSMILNRHRGNASADLAFVGNDKGNAIRLLTKHANIDLKDTIAFGDGNNDVSMLKLVHCGIAMGNGTEEAKQAADFVTDSIFDDGIYKALIRLNLANPPIPKANGEVLVAGLGNAAITPDALGEKVIAQILATRHVKKELERITGISELRSVAAVSTDVLGNTGMETAEILKGLTQQLRPKAVIVIDAMAARSLERLGKTVQISTAGIAPGAGVGNRRPQIDQALLGVPVISVGVPTVVDAATVAVDLLGEEHVTDEEKEKLREMVSPNGAAMFVTPREIDLLIQRGARMIGMAINAALNPCFTVNDFELLTK